MFEYVLLIAKLYSREGERRKCRKTVYKSDVNTQAKSKELHQGIVAIKFKITATLNTYFQIIKDDQEKQNTIATSMVIIETNI